MANTPPWQKCIKDETKFWFSHLEKDPYILQVSSASTDPDTSSPIYHKCCGGKHVVVSSNTTRHATWNDKTLVGSSFFLNTLTVTCQSSRKLCVALMSEHREDELAQRLSVSIQNKDESICNCAICGFPHSAQKTSTIPHSCCWVEMKQHPACIIGSKWHPVQEVVPSYLRGITPTGWWTKTNSVNTSTHKQWPAPCDKQ